MGIRIYHNPRCSKSRQTLEIIREHGIEPGIVEYLKTPPTAQELKQILALLEIGPRQLLRTGEDEYKSTGLDNMSLSDDEMIEIMVAHPKVIERPIVVKDDARAVIGRPPESVEKLFQA